MSVFIARQPILDREEATVAYELLFRSGWENFFPDIDGDEASVRVVHDSLMEFGLGTLVGTAKAYFNLSRRALLEGHYAVLPAENVVLELLEDIERTPEVLAACEELKKAGYVLALDDFGPEAMHAPLLELADIVKVDVLVNPKEVSESLVEKLEPYSVRLVAEKVETRTDHDWALERGFDLFQGYFYCRPEILEREELPSFKLNYMQFLREVHRPVLDFEALEAAIKCEASLSVKLLRLLNSAAFGLGREVTSIHHALILLGEQRLKKWGSIVVLSGLGEDKPSELVVTGLIRARFCERLSASSRVAGSELESFLTGLLSVMDALIGRPMNEILEELNVPEQTQKALAGEDNDLRRCYELVLAYEKGDWQDIARRVSSLDLPDEVMAGAYRSAVEWANEVFAEA